VLNMCDLFEDDYKEFVLGSKGHWERKCESFSDQRQKLINLRQTKPIMITGLFYTYHQIHFTSGNVHFCNISLYLSEMAKCRIGHLAMHLLVCILIIFQCYKLACSLFRSLQTLQPLQLWVQRGPRNGNGDK